MPLRFREFSSAGGSLIWALSRPLGAPSRSTQFFTTSVFDFDGGLEPGDKPESARL